jgi:hypothetical protein
VLLGLGSLAPVPAYQLAAISDQWAPRVYRAEQNLQRRLPTTTGQSTRWSHSRPRRLHILRMSTAVEAVANDRDHRSPAQPLEGGRRESSVSNRIDAAV